MSLPKPGKETLPGKHEIVIDGTRLEFQQFRGVRVTISDEAAEQKDLSVPERKRRKHGQRGDFEFKTQNPLIARNRCRGRRKVLRGVLESSRPLAKIEGTIPDGTAKVGQYRSPNPPFRPAKPKRGIHIVDEILRLVRGRGEGLRVRHERRPGHLHQIGKGLVISVLNGGKELWFVESSRGGQRTIGRVKRSRRHKRTKGRVNGRGIIMGNAEESPKDATGP